MHRETRSNEYEVIIFNCSERYDQGGHNVRSK